MIMEEAEEERQEGMKEKSYKRDGELVLSRGVWNRERWGMECKGRRTMKLSVSLWCRRSPPPPPLSFPLVGTFLISLLRRSLPQHYSKPLEFPGWEEQLQVKPSHKNGQTKKKSKKPRDEAKWEVGRRMRAVVDGGGNESQGSSAGPRWMVRGALSGISYRHIVNHSPHFFPVLCAVGRETTKLQLWCFFVLRLKDPMFSEVFTQFYDSSAPWDLLK